MKLTGDVTALEAFKVLDSSGNPVPAYLFLTHSKGQAPTGSLQMVQPLTDTMTIIATFATERTVTPVRFDLKDVPLP